MELLNTTVEQLRGLPDFDLCVEEFGAEASRVSAYGKVEPDFKAYETLESCGMLRLIAATEGGRLIGFASGFKVPSLHHPKSVLYLDCIFVRKSRRRGGPALRLFRIMRSLAHQDGMIGLMAGAPSGSAAERLFTAMGLQKIQTDFWAD